MNLSCLNELTALSQITAISLGQQRIHLRTFPRTAIRALVTVIMAIFLGNVQVANADPADYNDLLSIRAEALNEDFGASVDFVATVTYVDDAREFIFVQKDDDAIFVHRPKVGHVEPGHEVHVEGHLSKGDLLPIVSDPVVTVVGIGELPNSQKVSDIGLEHDCRYLTFEFEVLQTRVGVTNTVLYSKTESGKDFRIQIQHTDGIVFPNVSELAGSRVQGTGVLGLQIAGVASGEPGELKNKIVGYKLLCNSFDDLQIIEHKERAAASTATQMVGLPFLEKSSFPDERFLTFAQICLVEDAQPPGIVVCDGGTALRLNLQTKDNLQPGMLVRLGGQKRTNNFGRPEFDVDYLRHLGVAELSQPNPVSIEQAIATFKTNQRIAVEGEPVRVEDRHGRPHLILQEGDSNIVVNFQDDSIDSLSSLDPSIAKKVKITGITKRDSEYDFQLDVIRANDVQLVQRKASLSRIFAISLGALTLICGFSAFWIKLLKGKVDQQQRFETIFDNSGCPSIVLNGNLQIDDANQMAADMTGYSKDQLRKMTIPELDKQSSVMQFKEILRKTMDQEEVAVFPTKIQTQDKRLLDVEIHCRNLSASGNPENAKYIAVFPDVTARNEYESELKKARDEAVKANKAKSQFVASISHELRTPINGVMGMTQLLESTDLTPKQADYLAACRASGETLLTVIGDVLDFSKMEAGKLELDPQPTKLIPFVENIVRATSLQQGTRHVDLASFVDPRLNRSVMVDANRLRQVLFNLLGNAAKFTTKGSITVTAACSQITDEHADIRFIVSDTGIGIPKNRVASLFEAFEQFDSSTTREFGGTGLGLTICKQIVDLMGGEIRAKSEVGKGSDFVVEVRLPLATQNNSPERDKDLVGTTKRVAVVGMSAPIARILRQMYDSYQVDATFHRETDILLENEIDVVLLNNKGDWKSVRNFIDTQYAWSDENAPVVIPVVPASCPIDLRQWKRKGIAAPIFKPFTQSRFLQPVDSREKLGENKNADAKPDSIESITLQDRALRVLICEDNRVNQMFAKEICRAAGIQAVVRENGQLGIETLEIDGRFDAIFMDCNMPVMDGYEAARKIREMTQSGTTAKIPVIALTANALASDRENCRAAGMDDYLTKPYEVEDFLEKVHVHTNTTAPTELTSAQTKQPRKEIFNLEKLLTQFDNSEFVFGLAEQFASSLPEFREDFQECLNQQDVNEAVKVAHRLKGTSGTAQAERINALTVEIEAAGRAGQLELLESQIAEILQEFDNFTEVLDNQTTDSKPNLADSPA